MLVSCTLVREYQRTRCITLLSLLTVGNVLYSSVTPVIAYYAPVSAVIFSSYVSDARMLIDESGLTRVMLAATLFQLVCLGVALGAANQRSTGHADARYSGAVIDAAILVGWGMFLLGLAGVIWLGMIYNGHPWGLYEISYAERSSLFRENSTQSFLMLVGLYGASQLTVVFLMTDRVKMATLILLLITLHGLGIKSKFPVFWVLFVFMIAVINERKKIFKCLLPIGISVLVILTMSVLRGVDGLSELPDYISMNQGEIVGQASRFWENDIPGPSSITYYVINDPAVEFTPDPVFEILKLLVPRLVYDRGAVVAEDWAAKMMGGNYEPGLGFGWSLLCDGFLVGGWLGILLVAYCVAKLAQYISDLKTSGRGCQIFFYSMVAYTCSPIFVMGFRESVGGLVKALLIMTVLLWMPTLMLARAGKSRVTVTAHHEP